MVGARSHGGGLKSWWGLEVMVGARSQGGG